MNFIIKTIIPSLLFAANLCAESSFLYHSEEEKSQEASFEYSKTNFSISRYLSYRDLPRFFKISKGLKALDYGSGTGISTKYLIDSNFIVTGVDVSKNMLEQARLAIPDVPFLQIESGIIPFQEKEFDLVFSSLVLFEISSRDEIVLYLNEAERVMKDDGLLIALTASTDAYSKDWLTFNVDFPENKDLKSGNIVRMELPDVGLEFTDYYWTEDDYLECFAAAGFELLAIHHPLGYESDIPWKEERNASPFVIFVARKYREPTYKLLEGN